MAVLLYHRQGIAWHIDREPIWNNALEWAAKNIRKANIGVKVVYEWVDEPTADLTVESLMERTYWGADIEVLRHYLESVLGGNIGSEYTQPQGRIIYKYFN